MALTYDQSSQVHMALVEAHVDADRRRTQRIRQSCIAEISPWHGNRAGTAFGVHIEDFSTTGVGITHNDRLKVGQQYLLEIPRPDQRPLAVVFTVVRCSQTAGGLFNVELAPDEVLDVAFSISNQRRAAATGGADRTGMAAFRLTLIVLAFAASVAAVFFNLL
jgi:hypothetical protein